MRILVTGSSKGIGRAMAVELARRGHDVVATARRPEALADLDVAARLALDVTDTASVRAAVAAAGDLDAVVNNAGEVLVGSIEDTPLAEARRLLEVNLLGSLAVTQAVLPALRARGGGRLVFTSSVLGRITLPVVGVYTATKWALEALAETTATEAAGFGVKVTLLEPGGVSSGALDAPPTYLSEPYLPLARELGSGGMITVEEVAVATADVLEQADPPLRLPIGAFAEQVLGVASA